MTERPQSLSIQTATSHPPSLPPLFPIHQPPLASPPVPTLAASTALIPSASTPATNTGAAIALGAFPDHQDAYFTKVESAAEEEPYTIKCICGFGEDDGNTIYCEICDSWQHIECYYPDNTEEATREEFSHACSDCKPRSLDVEHAVAYQKRQRLQTASAAAPTSIVKPKRPPPKGANQSHKKKSKPSELLLNGHSTAATDAAKHPTSAHDPSGQHPHLAPKKSRSSHRSSHSMSNGHTKRSPSYSASRALLQHGHPLSPVTTPPDLPDGVEIYHYSTDFLSRCNNQEAVPSVQNNSFISLAVSNATSIWLREPDRMLRETGHKFADVFQALLPNIEAIKCPPRVETKTRIIGQELVVPWRYLAAPVAVDKDVPLMELNGQVGFQKDYCSIPSNRYEELSCPLPFVFFHPLLPLYIDTRREGSEARYVRRSCRPNAVLDTYLSGGSEYHFWLVSDRHIAADEQITIPWDFRLPHDAKGRMLRLLGLGDDDVIPYNELKVEEEEYNNIARWVFLILSEYGGCACDMGNGCAFARFHRNFSSRSQHTRIDHGSSKKKGSRKPKPNALSPTSTGHATDSRAASEGHTDDSPESDKLSNSSRSKPPSRDMTPAPRQGSFDTLGILTEPTDRDKRKVAMVEDSFRRLEQSGPRKKKRISDGTSPVEKAAPSPGKPKSKLGGRSTNLPVEHVEANGGLAHHYADASTSRSKSGSPMSSTSPIMSEGVHNSHMFSSISSYAPTTETARQRSTAPSAGYCNASTQTEPTEGEWYSAKSPAPRAKRRIVSLSKRLLNGRLRARLGCTSQVTRQPPMRCAASAMDVDSPLVPASKAQSEARTDDKKIAAIPFPDDVDMRDDSEATVGADSEPPPPAAIVQPLPPAVQALSIEPPPPLLNAADNENKAHNILLTTKTEVGLHVQLPKVSTLNENVSATGASTSTPLSALSIVQSPFSLTNASLFGSPVVTPSPVKKKMSLSDYTKSRKAAASRPSVGSIAKPVTFGGDEAKSAPGADCAGVLESPTTGEKTTEASTATTQG